MQVLLYHHLNHQMVIFKPTGRQCNAGDCMKLNNVNLEGQAALKQDTFF